jgi:tetratricopeptide (TPR) repeat protein
MRGAAPLASRTRCREIDTRFADFLRSVSPRGENWKNWGLEKLGTELVLSPAVLFSLLGRSMTKEEIIATVKENSRVVVWLTEKASFISIPFNDILVWWGDAGDAIERATRQVAALGFPADHILFIEGVTGIAALDPEWDGSDTFFREDSDCQIAHSIDQLVAERLFQKAHPAVGWYELGLRSCDSGNYERAAAAFREVIDLSPEFLLPNAWERLGFACIKLRQEDQAVRAYNQAIRLKPDFRTAWYNLGVAYTHQGNRAGVTDVHEKLKALDRQLADEFFRECVEPLQGRS